MLTTKVLSVMVWLLLLCVPATVVSLGVGLPLNATDSVDSLLLGAVLMAAAVTIAGLGTSCRRPCEADHDSLRVRPAPVPSVLGYGLRMIIMLSLLAPLREINLYPPEVSITCAVLLAIVAGFIVVRAYRAFLDGAQLCAAFKV
jgi:hypothetical protein